MTEIAQTIPGENPADNDSLAGLNNYLQDKIFLHLEKVIPGIVQSYDKTKNRAVIKPAITGVATQGQKVSKEVLTNIPVLQLGGIIKFPISAGMTGWLIASDRDISIFKSIKEETAPNTTRKHKYQDSFFIPDSINLTGSDNLEISTSTDINMAGANINIAPSSDLKINNTAGVSGTFKSDDNKIITVTKGIITAIE